MSHGPPAAAAGEPPAASEDGASEEAEIMPDERRVVWSRRDLSEIAFRVSWWGYNVILLEAGRLEWKDLRTPTCKSTIS